MATTMCLSGAAMVKAGLNIPNSISSADVFVGADFVVDHWINQAESVINANIRFNFTDAYGTLNADTKMILNDVASSLAAINIIQYDMNSYTTRIEAEDMVNIQRDIALRGLSILRDKKQQDFINGA